MNGNELNEKKLKNGRFELRKWNKHKQTKGTESFRALLSFLGEKGPFALNTRKSLTLHEKQSTSQIANMNGTVQR